MTSELPKGISIIVIGPSGAALGRRLRAALPNSELHGPRARTGDWDKAYHHASAHIAGLFAAGRPIVGICASGILIRVAGAVARRQARSSRRSSPSPKTVRSRCRCSAAITAPTRSPAHLPRRCGGIAAITTAGDLRLGFALDEPPPGWRIANPERVKPVAAALLAGRPVALDRGGRRRPIGCAPARSNGPRRAAVDIIVTDRAPAA